MKAIKAYFVISNSASKNSQQKIAGVFWTHQNAKKYAWQLCNESADHNSEETFTVETRHILETAVREMELTN